MKNILNRGFSTLTLNDFIAKVKAILAALTGNAYFATTDPTVAAVSTQLGKLDQAMALLDPNARDAAVTAERATLEQMLDDLADSLEKTAAGDPVKLATTGYDTRQAPTATTEAPIPQNVRAKAIGNGECQVLMDGVAGAKSVEVQTATDPNGTWTTYDTFSSSRGIVLKGFGHGKDIWVRARTLGPNNLKSLWSDPATTLIS